MPFWSSIRVNFGVYSTDLNVEDQNWFTTSDENELTIESFEEIGEGLSPTLIVDRLNRFIGESFNHFQNVKHSITLYWHQADNSVYVRRINGYTDLSTRRLLADYPIMESCQLTLDYNSTCYQFRTENGVRIVQYNQNGMIREIVNFGNVAGRITSSERLLLPRSLRTDEDFIRNNPDQHYIPIIPTQNWSYPSSNYVFFYDEEFYFQQIDSSDIVSVTRDGRIFNPTNQSGRIRAFPFPQTNEAALWVFTHERGDTVVQILIQSDVGTVVSCAHSIIHQELDERTIIKTLIGYHLGEMLRHSSPYQVIGRRVFTGISAGVIREMTGNDTINVRALYQDEINAQIREDSIYRRGVEEQDKTSKSEVIYRQSFERHMANLYNLPTIEPDILDDYSRIEFSKLKDLISNDEILRLEVLPVLQPFAGPPGTENRIVTGITTKREKIFSKCRYNFETQEPSSPI